MLCFYSRIGKRIEYKIDGNKILKRYNGKKICRKRIVIGKKIDIGKKIELARSILIVVRLLIGTARQKKSK